MVHQPPFLVEQFMDKYESGIAHNMGETCVESLSVADLQRLTHTDLTPQILAAKLTYGDIRGSDALKAAIALVYNANGADRVAPDHVVVTNGAIGANFLAFYSLVAPGDTVIVVDPTYQQLSAVPGMFSGNQANVIPWKLAYDDGFQPRLDDLRSLVEQHRPRLVVINNPNNPTGVVWNDASLQGIIDICRPHGVRILCDEVYRPLFHSVPASPRLIVQFGYEHAISTSSISKAFSFAGLRVGWIVCPSAAIRSDLWEKRDYNTISVGVLDDLVAAHALQHAQVLLERSYRICVRNLAVIDEFIRSSNGAYSWVRPAGGSTCFIRINADIDVDKMCQDLAQSHATLAVPGSVFGKQWTRFVRIGFGNNPEAIQRGLAELHRWVQTSK
ncbi:PLP-dependent transferase [Suhomyces tanzawaensis NRRL Y-17324]|uniref:PLP-dependent transferase n=1 Tax=Suhomyces tanzawaensis NRRL Y-17324 TaxID=984487 RepID=A0A1E4SCS2_9ASCO|nr:PLP-dependent transferase [Suhomyces tanzawaensis NRRL Y-17324]ODV77192.1 PLP-dependent transferase [Suhomyces tanzawaensis NRRL Y-17324]